MFAAFSYAPTVSNSPNRLTCHHRAGRGATVGAVPWNDPQMQADSGRRRSFFGLKLRKTQLDPSEFDQLDQVVPSMRAQRSSSAEMETGWQARIPRQASSDVPATCRHPSDMSSATDVSFESARQALQLRQVEEAQR